ncbi:MAG: hypothetical protein UX59_C0019G0012 [Microgenomates group bacterium GW2011_GWA1_46_7]|nr:MAG: hypothetical protein UX59_C0019G0012 [Microgenomates group bacterium GW2011_GWA1_46_7]
MDPVPTTSTGTLVKPIHLPPSLKAIQKIGAQRRITAMLRKRMITFDDDIVQLPLADRE